MQPHDHQMPPHQNPNQQQPQNSGLAIRLAVALGVFVVLALLVCVALWLYLFHPFSDDHDTSGSKAESRLGIGDCLVEGGALKAVDCNGSASTVKIFGIIEHEDLEACSYAAGAEKGYVNTLADPGTRPVYCIGPKDTDAATHINAVRGGQCLKVDVASIPDSTIVDCSTPGAWEVTKLLDTHLDRNISAEKVTELCGADRQAIGWGVVRDEKTATYYPRGACLEQKR